MLALSAHCKANPEGLVREMAYTGRRVADEAFSMGLVNRSLKPRKTCWPEL